MLGAKLCLYANRAGSIPGHKKTPGVAGVYFGGLGRNVHIAVGDRC